MTRHKSTVAEFFSKNYDWASAKLIFMILYLFAYKHKKWRITMSLAGYNDQYIPL